MSGAIESVPCQCSCFPWFNCQSVACHLDKFYLCLTVLLFARADDCYEGHQMYTTFS